MHIDNQMKDFVIDLLKSKIPADYYYHNYEHTLYVLGKVIEIGMHEDCSDKDLQLLAAAALWHDTGYVNIYKGHEEESCLLARQHLPGFGYATADIDKVCGMIMATKIPQSPKTKPEEIIADADLEYLSTNDAALLAHNLFKELNAINPLLTASEWNRVEIEFLTVHNYFTGYCKAHKEHLKHAYLKSLMSNKT